MGGRRRCERTNGCEQTHVRASIVECSKESRRALGARTPAGGMGVNSCHPVAKVFPSGWNGNASLYTERSSPGARIRFQSRGNLLIGCVPRIFHDAELCGANGAQWHNNSRDGYDRDRLALWMPRTWNSWHAAARLINANRVGRHRNARRYTHRYLQAANAIKNYTWSCYVIDFAILTCVISGPFILLLVN